MNTLVVDASVVVKWLITTEALVKEANEVLASTTRLLAPDLVRIEVSNALRRLAIQGLLTREQADERFDKLCSLRRLKIRASSAHLKEAWNVALKAPGRHIQDSLYLALALAEGCKLITADDVFFKTLKGTEYEGHAVFLGQVPVV